MRIVINTLAVACVVSASSCAHHAHEGERHHGMGGAVKTFHDVISPVYHQAPGAARDEQTCAALPKLKDASVALAAEKADAAKNDAMAQALSALDAACQVAGRAEVSAKFEGVHDAFHAYVEHGHP